MSINLADVQAGDVQRGDRIQRRQQQQQQQQQNNVYMRLSIQTASTFSRDKQRR